MEDLPSQEDQPSGRMGFLERILLAKSVRSAFDWKRAMNQFAILFGERFTLARG